MKYVIYVIIVILTVASCKKSKEVSKIVGQDWLIGKWENKSDKGNLLEIWKKANDSLFVGESYFIKVNDTLHSEKMELQQKGEFLLYVSTIKGQNNDKPLTFNQKIETENQLIFENPKNEYPRKILYQPHSKDRIFIVVSGKENGKPSTIRYSLKKTE